MSERYVLPSHGMELLAYVEPAHCTYCYEAEHNLPDKQEK